MKFTFCRTCIDLEIFCRANNLKFAKKLIHYSQLFISNSVKVIRN